ncbi:MAG TPA: hypothetical protein VNU95_02190 [Candidatus Acidoferrales bacterium]|nr:hypothetical protein [Candidatus Acidoferrales bacterium]
MKTSKWILVVRILKWILGIGVGLSALIVTIYVEEDWRGKLDWGNCKRELEAKGQSVDWNDYIPPAVPDDQNFFKAPKMQEWFVKNDQASTNELNILVANKEKRATIENKKEAVGFLSWSSQFQPDFDLIQEALKRPYARMDGDYTEPYAIPIPNLVNVRAVSEVLAQRAKCFLLLDRPEEALHDITLLNDSRQMFEEAPSGKPMPLVTVMVNVLVVGVYAGAITNGLQSHGWSEPQLKVLQNQLGQINLFPFLRDALRENCGFFCHMIEIAAIDKFAQSGVSNALARGWFYQNMVTIARWHEEAIDSIDLTNDLLIPDKVDSMEAEDAAIKHFTPYKFMAAIMVPNYSKAFYFTAYNQTFANEAQIACALERYRLAHGEYPETLNALTPQYMQIIPHDIIGGQPLHYRRTDDGKFQLYSIGWNETDDGGQPSPRNENGGIDYSKGDWVWPN